MASGRASGSKRFACFFLPALPIAGCGRPAKGGTLDSLAASDGWMTLPSGCRPRGTDTHAREPLGGSLRSKRPTLQERLLSGPRSCVRVCASKHRMPTADKDYEPGAAMRALSDLSQQLDPDVDRLTRMKKYLEEDERTLEEEKSAADAASSEVAELQAQLAAMESESRRLQAILELEQMKNMLLGVGLEDGSRTAAPPMPRSAWGEERGGAPEEEPDALSAADEARLARLMAADDDDDEGAIAFAAQAPSEMAATLAAMEQTLSSLQQQKANQDQEARLSQLRSELAAEQSNLAKDAARLERMTRGGASA